MRVVCLIDDQRDEPLLNEHGISFYCETNRHRILFDVGQSDAFIKNAQSLGIDIRQVDIVVISHGHYDHGGGLKAFLKINHQAQVYIQSSAFQYFYSLRENQERVYIGLDQSLWNHPQVHLVDGDYKIDDELFLMNDLKSHQWFPKGNQTLFLGQALDTFEHEQSLLVYDQEKYILLAGCAHRGIFNIVFTASQFINNDVLDLVIGGFHLGSRHPEYLMSKEDIHDLSLALMPLSKHYVTGHCTGERGYNLLDEVLKSHIQKFYPGWTKEID